MLADTKPGMCLITSSVASTRTRTSSSWRSAGTVNVLIRVTTGCFTSMVADIGLLLAERSRTRPGPPDPAPTRRHAVAGRALTKSYREAGRTDRARTGRSLSPAVESPEAGHEVAVRLVGAAQAVDVAARRVVDEQRVAVAMERAGAAGERGGQAVSPDHDFGGDDLALDRGVAVGGRQQAAQHR